MKILQTFASRFIILILSFGLVILSTNIWGSEGKGLISLIVANLTIVGFVTNIIVGSSTTYFASKFGKAQVLFYGYVWAFFAGLVAPFLFVFVVSAELMIYLVLLSILSALLTANINFFVGIRNIKMFNVYTILQLLLHIVLVLVLYFLFHIQQPEVYFQALIVCNFILFLVSFFHIFKRERASFFSTEFSFTVFRQMFRYGRNIQFSSFMQFFNYRSSYYFLEFFKGLSSVGIFSVGVAVSEAVWTVSRSISLVLYSEAVNSENSNFLLQRTKISLKFSFLITLIFIIAAILVPGWVYMSVFGKEFHQTREIVLLLAPGILAMASSNVVGYYFAGINKLKILNLKSFIALIFTILLSFLLIPKFGMKGACIATSVSHCVSSFVLFWEFYKKTPFRIEDFVLSKSEIKNILSRIKYR